MVDEVVTSKLVRLILLLYAAGDIAKLRDAWHDDLEVTSHAGDTFRGADEVAALTRAISEEDRVALDPETVRINGGDALIDGYLLYPDGSSRPVTWLWSFRDGKLWRSVTFDRDVVPILAPDRSAAPGR